MSASSSVPAVPSVADFRSRLSAACPAEKVEAEVGGFSANVAILAEWLVVDLLAGKTVFKTEIVARSKAEGLNGGEGWSLGYVGKLMNRGYGKNNAIGLGNVEWVAPSPIAASLCAQAVTNPEALLEKLGKTEAELFAAIEQCGKSVKSTKV